MSRDLYADLLDAARQAVAVEARFRDHPTVHPSVVFARQKVLAASRRLDDAPRLEALGRQRDEARRR